MTALRWVLGLIILLLGGGYLFLFVVSNGFRRSFGASENNPLLAILPLAAAAILLAALVWPGNRMLLHLGAVAAVGLIGFCVWQMISESATVLLFGILYLAVWLVFYWMAAWHAPTTTGP
jgi:hypothetical protein